jgi:hypothetical protein
VEEKGGIEFWKKIFHCGKVDKNYPLWNYIIPYCPLYPLFFTVEIMGVFGKGEYCPLYPLFLLQKLEGVPGPHPP